MRVTAWYVGTFALVLAMLGTLLFAALARDVSRRASTRRCARRAREIARATSAEAGARGGERWRCAERGARRAQDSGPAALSLRRRRDIHSRPASADGECSRSRARPRKRDRARRRWEAPHDLSLQAYAARFTTGVGAHYVAAAVVNRDTIDDRYAMLLAYARRARRARAMCSSRTGGWLLARKSVAPVEHTMRADATLHGGRGARAAHARCRDPQPSRRHARACRAMRPRTRPRSRSCAWRPSGLRRS